MGRRGLQVAQGAAVGLVVLLFALLVWKLFSGGTGALAAEVARGETPAAPDFTATRLDREGELTLSSLRGKAVLVNFFASWCIPACSSEAPVLEKTWREYRDSGLVVLGVDYNDLTSDAQHFMRRFDLTYPVVHDGSRSIGDRYGISGLPETYVVGRDGRVVDAIIGSIITNQDRKRLKRAVERALTS
jgi:cytochrome c biogenesis protein CcmG/thiol:disulfide interchange protein DsbE